MAVKNFPNVSPDANPSFTLESNTSSFESSLNKSVQHMELPGARWRGSVAFSNRTRQEANKIKAFMTSLGGQVGRFYLTPFDAYQSGTMSGNGVVDGVVSFGSSTIPTKGWEGGQDKLFEAGDYIEVGGELKMVTEDVSAPQSYIEYTGTNYMPSPFDPEGWEPDAGPDGTITNVTLANPSGSSIVGLAEQTGANYYQLTATYGLPVVAGDSVYTAILVKKTSVSDFVVTLRISDSISSKDARFLSSDSFNVGFSAMNETKTTDLGDGFYLIQAKLTSLATGNAFSQIILMTSGGGVAPIGSQLYVQAAYFGKADDYPAQLLATADIPIAPPLRKSLTGGESITVANPKGKFYLGSNDQSWDINVNGVQSMGFDFIEDVN